MFSALSFNIASQGKGGGLLGPSERGKELVYPLLHEKAVQTFVPADYWTDRSPVTLGQEFGQRAYRFYTSRDSAVDDLLPWRCHLLAAAFQGRTLS